MYLVKLKKYFTYKFLLVIKLMNITLILKLKIKFSERYFIFQKYSFYRN